MSTLISGVGIGLGIILIFLAVIAFFVISLVSFLVAKAKNRRVPGSCSNATVNTWMVMLIISSIILLLALVISIGFFILLSGAISFM